MRALTVLAAAALVMMITVVPTAPTFAQGASVGKPDAATNAITFTKDVAPILQRSCQNCHRPNSIAPMSMLAYDEVSPWARAIKAKVASLPGRYVVRAFANDGAVTTQADITVIVNPPSQHH